MKIQHRAALEVIVGTVAAIGIAMLVSIGLDALLEAYGLRGVLILMGVVAGGLFMNLIYQIRVSQLKYLDTLNKTVDR